MATTDVAAGIDAPIASGSAPSNASTPPNGKTLRDAKDADWSVDRREHGLSDSSRDQSIDEGSSVVAFARDDPENPFNWTRTKKLYVVLTCIALVMNSTMGSSLPSGASKEIQKDFDITNDELLVFPVSMYLMGYVLGPLVFGPLSESYGRKWVMTGTFLVFTAFSLGSALAPTFAGLVVMRLLVGIGASTPISVIGGIYADIYRSPKARGRAVVAFMAATMWGPLIGPIVSGFVSVVSWRWAFWIELIVAGATWPFLIFMPETYGPIILLHRAKKLRKETGDGGIVAPVELQQRTRKQFVKEVLMRPVNMFFQEWIILTSCLYLALAYSIFYLFFQAYDIIYEGIYGFNAGEEGLAFLPIGVGCVFAAIIFLAWEQYHEKAQTRDPKPAWAEREEYHRLPVACLGAPLFAISLFWLGWTARASVPWIVPMLSGLPFGVGFLLIFMSLINYIVDSYEAFAASALAAASCSRSLCSVALPFAARPMYLRLGVAWACSLLGFLSIAMGVVPFIFIRYGEHIRNKSALCHELHQKKLEDEEKQRRVEERIERQQHGEKV